MAREVRITIDDDEVFERMKARKQALDLSWEEVLHRGLRDVSGEHAEEPNASGSGSDGPGSPRGVPEWDGVLPGPHGHNSARSGQPRGRRGRSGTTPDEVGPADTVGELVDDIKAQVHEQVRESLRASMESVDAAGSDLEREVTELERAEDATLEFEDAVGDDRRHRVPLRVRVETSRDGMDVSVVAVREGKSVADENQFDSATRRAVNEHLARGGTATLSFGGDERYEVAPMLGWGHGGGGQPTVTAVEVEEVIFDD